MPEEKQSTYSRPKSKVLILLFDTARMLSRNSNPEQTWKRCGENLVKYTPSGTYYVRARVAGKLHVKSLETPVLTVARQQLNDEIHKLRARAASAMAVRTGKMRVADAVAIYRERMEADAHIIIWDAIMPPKNAPAEPPCARREPKEKVRAPPYGRRRQFRPHGHARRPDHESGHASMA